MSTIGGPGGIGGPSGPGGPDGPDGPDGPEGPGEVGSTTGAAGTERADAASSTTGTTGAADVDALAAEVAAGRLTPREAVDRLVDTMAGPELDAADRAELREMLTDLVASDPYLGGLVGRV